MKRLLSILILACTLSACENDGVVSAPTPQGSAITFGSVETRVPVTSADDILSFDVWAQRSLAPDTEYEENQSVEYLHILEGERVYRDDVLSPWQYDNIRYWVDDRTFHFFGVYPNNLTVNYGALPAQGGFSCNGYMVTFDTPTTADVDLMTCFKSEVTTTSDTYPHSVDMQFKHELVNVRFKIVQDLDKGRDDLSVRLNYISLINAKKKGWLLTSRYSSYTPTWSLDGTVQSYTYNWPNGKVMQTLEECRPWPWNDNGDSGLLLIPQTINTNNKVGLVLNYDVKYPEESEWRNKEVRLESLPAGAWVGGTQVTYSIALYEENFIVVKSVDVSVETWGTSGSGGTIIIK